jgi:peptidoglycan/xylan/chitin deacetylase (PgdA/CDA1 family)
MLIRKITFKILYYLSFLVSKNTNKGNLVTVVCFHRISNNTDHSLPSMRLDVFHRLIKFFAKNYTVITLEDVFKQTSKPKLIITFDDGYKDFISGALPILAHYNVPAIMNVVVQSVITGKTFWTQKISFIVNKKIELKQDLKININHKEICLNISIENSEACALELYELLKDLSVDQRTSIIDQLFIEVGDEIKVDFMDTNDLNVCIDNNVIIGSHSFSHESLSETVDEKILHKEIFESKAELKESIDQNVEIFASPNGAENPKIIELASEAGYKYFLTTTYEVYSPKLNSKIDIVPRILLYDKTAEENIMRTKYFHAKLKKILKN